MSLKTVSPGSGLRSRPNSFSGDLEPESGDAPLVVHSRHWLRELSWLMYELFCFSMALLAVVFVSPVTSHQVDLIGLLALRVSVINVLTGGICIAFWGLLLYMMTPHNNARPAMPSVLINASLRTICCAGIAMLLVMIRRPAMATAGHVVLFMSLGLALLLLGEMVTAGYRSLVQPSIRKERTVLIVGAGWRGQRLQAELRANKKWHYRFLGFVDSHPPKGSQEVLGGVEDLEVLLMERAVDDVMITLPVKSMYDDIQMTIEACERLGVQCRYSTDLFNTRILKSGSVDRDDASSVRLHLVHTEIARGFKRLLDIVIAGTGLLLLSPVLIAITIVIKYTSPGPALFLQKRYGLNKRLFTIYKFRTMVTEAETQQAHLEHLNENDGPAFKIKSDPRITRAGSFLRRTSLDELPQLWNVLIGDMSLVGPRPLPVRDVSRFAHGWLMRRFSVPPGITGLWQVSGRSNLTFDRWIKLDLEYIDHWSFLLDLEILIKTFPAVLKKDGAS